MKTIELKEMPEVVKSFEDYFGIKNLDKDTLEIRRMFDTLYYPFCKNENLDVENYTLEECLDKKGFRVEMVLANLPFEQYFEFINELNEELKRKNLKRGYLIPAWWLPNIMEGIIQKDLLPFANYVK